MTVMETATDKKQDVYRLPDHWIMPAEGLFPICHAARVGRAVELVRLSGARTVLEVGCGDGWNCAQLLKAGLRVVGIDRNRKAITYARLLVPEADFEACACRDAMFLNRFPDPFDAVLLVEVIEHLPPTDCLALLRNVVSCLRPGGTLVVTAPSTNIESMNPQQLRLFDVATLRDLIEQSGELRVELVEGYGDVRFEKRYYRRARWFENRYYRIKPLLHRLEGRYRAHVAHTPMSHCRGLIASAQRTES